MNQRNWQQVHTVGLLKDYSRYWPQGGTEWASEQGTVIIPFADTEKQKN